MARGSKSVVSHFKGVSSSYNKPARSKYGLGGKAALKKSIGLGLKWKGGVRGGSGPLPRAVRSSYKGSAAKMRTKRVNLERVMMARQKRVAGRTPLQHSVQKGLASKSYGKNLAKLTLRHADGGTLHPPKALNSQAAAARTLRHHNRSSIHRSVAKSLSASGGLRKMGFGAAKGMMSQVAKVNPRTGIRGERGRYMKRDAHGRFA